MKLNRYDDSISCSRRDCGLKFHSKCIHINTQELVDLNQSGELLEWICQKCRNCPDKPQTNTSKAKSKSNQQEDDNLPVLLKSMKEAQDRNFEALKQQFQMNFEDIKTKMIEIEKSQEFLSSKYEELLLKLNTQKNYDNIISEFQVELEKKQTKVDDLTSRINKLEQLSRKNNIEFREVAEVENENLEDIVIKIAKKVNVEISKNDIDIVHRVKKRNPGKIAPIICKFTNEKTRDNIIKEKRRTLTNQDVLGLGTGKIYIGENLSPFYKDLLWKTKTKCKLIDYKFVWWKDNILVRKNENNPVIPINSDKDLEELK